MRKRSSFVIFGILIFLLASFVAGANFVAGECVVPSNNIVITKDTELCAGNYNLNEGIIIDADDIFLNCSNAKIIGEFIETGINVKEKSNVNITNCIIKDFSTGIHVKGSTKVSITNNILNNNRIGVILENSPDTAITNNEDTSYLKAIEIIETKKSNSGAINSEINNKQPEKEEEKDAIPLTEITENIGNIKEQETNIAEKEIIKESIPNDLSASILKNIVTIRASDHEKAISAVKIEKTKTIKEGKTAYETRITALEDKKGLVLYEYFPKNVAEHVRDINFDETFILVEEDPIVKKDIGNMKKDEVVVITYNLDKAISGDTNPSSIVTIENSSRLINTLANISYILAMYLVLVIIKKYKADKMLKEFKTKTKKLLGVPFPIAYVVLSIIPSINYRFLASETIAIVFYSFAIIVLLAIIFMLAKEK